MSRIEKFFNATHPPCRVYIRCPRLRSRGAPRRPNRHAATHGPCPLTGLPWEEPSQRRTWWLMVMTEQYLIGEVLLLLSRLQAETPPADARRKIERLRAHAETVPPS